VSEPRIHMPGRELGKPKAKPAYKRRRSQGPKLPTLSARPALGDAGYATYLENLSNDGVLTPVELPSRCS
jgi:hypothetical protein